MATATLPATLEEQLVALAIRTSARTGQAVELTLGTGSLAAIGHCAPHAWDYRTTANYIECYGWHGDRNRVTWIIRITRKGR